MKRIYSAFTIASILLSSAVFANESSDMSQTACTPIVNACKAAGFERHHGNKEFWKNCMRPLLLGKSVKGVNVSSDQVNACRKQKIDTMQEELKNLQDVK